MRKHLLIVLMLVLIGSFQLGLTLMQERSVKVTVKIQDGKLLTLYNASYALVIGVSIYTNGWPTLPQAVNDAREIKTTLEQHGFVVTLVENPTAAQLENALKDFIATRGLGAENRLLFYFAGHGYTQKKAYGADLGYIVPSDVPLPDKDQAGFLRKVISMENFNSYAREINAKHVLFLFDSCFSGSIFALARAVPAVITYKTSEPVRQFITAGAADETVPDKSIFKQQFLEALKSEGDSNKDGYVTGTELGEFLQTQVVNYSRESQHPQYGKIRDPRLDKGDFVFIVPLALPPKTTFDPNQYQTEANRLAANKAQWEKWQSEMGGSFQKVQSLDRDANLAASSKAQMWQEFLNSYVNDNPYSQEDDTMRREASNRQNYWRTYFVQWEKWQSEMGDSFQKMQSLDRDANLVASSKAQKWQEFLNSYANDNPYSQEDDTMRREASQRQNYWRTYFAQPKYDIDPSRSIVNFQGNYDIDASHSNINFTVRHLVVAKVSGSFREFSGAIMYDEKDVTKSSVNVTIKAKSIDTQNDRRDGHLRSPDFFNTEKDSMIMFASKSIRKSGGGYIATGDLTIRGVTKRVDLPFQILGVRKDVRSVRMGIEAALTINRFDYDVKWDRTLDDGNLVVGKDVQINLTIEAAMKKP